MKIEDYLPKTGRMLKENNTTINLADLFANMINPTSGNLNVDIQDQSTEIIDLHLSRTIQTVTLSVNTSIDNNLLDINADTIPSIGNIIGLREENSYYQGEILSVVDNGGGSYTVGLDTPLDFAYTTSAIIREESINLAVDGSVTPVIFSVSPKELNSTVSWDIVRVLGSIIDNVAMDDGKFGGISKLQKGIVFRTTDGIVTNIFNAKSNGDLAAHMFDVTYIPSTLGPSGNYGLRWRRTFGGQSKNGVVCRLHASTNEEFQIIVQDDLTALVSFHAIVQGHVTN